jgi:hypothetical protein
MISSYMRVTARDAFRNDPQMQAASAGLDTV